MRAIVEARKYLDNKNCDAGIAVATMVDTDIFSCRIMAQKEHHERFGDNAVMLECPVFVYG